MTLEQRVAVLEAEVARLKQVMADEEAPHWSMRALVGRLLDLQMKEAEVEKVSHAYDCVQVQR